MVATRPNISLICGEAWPDIEELAEQLLIKGRVNFLQTERGIERGGCHQHGAPPRRVPGRAPRWSILSKE